MRRNLINYRKRVKLGVIGALVICHVAFFVMRKFEFIPEIQQDNRPEQASIIVINNVTEASKRLGVTRKTLSLLLNCKSAMSPEMAIRVGKATGTTPESWLYMQAKLNLWFAEKNSTKVESFEKRIAV